MLTITQRSPQRAPRSSATAPSCFTLCKGLPCRTPSRQPRTNPRASENHLGGSLSFGKEATSVVYTGDQQVLPSVVSRNLCKTYQSTEGTEGSAYYGMPSVVTFLLSVGYDLLRALRALFSDFLNVS